MVTHILPGGLRYLTRSQPPGEVHLGRKRDRTFAQLSLKAMPYLDGAPGGRPAAVSLTLSRPGRGRRSVLATDPESRR